jgi:hypothetical protein
MRFGQRTRIIYDNGRDALHFMHGYRGLFDFFAQDTTVVLADTEDKLRSSFQDDTAFSITLMVCHGWGKTDADAVLNWRLHKAVNDIEWEDFDLQWTKENIRHYVGCGKGLLLNTACWSGKQVWADAFLDAGFSSYVAHQGTSDMFSAYQFVAAFMGYLVYEVRDTARKSISVQEAVTMANNIDALSDGAMGFKCFER